jgi:integrase
METEAQGEQPVARKVVFHRVAENLYRLDTSGTYYALLKRGDKQFRRSLKTKDRKLADRRLSELRKQVGNLKISEEGRQTFADLAKRWLAASEHALKPSTVLRRKLYVKSLSPFFEGLPVRNIQARHCERWATERAPKIAPLTVAYELATMKALFKYALELGLMLSNPARHLKRPKITSTQISVPAREQFKNLIAAIRRSDGRADSQRKASSGADLVELLAYSGCRIQEATALRWADVDFKENSLRITGGETGTKNHQPRTIPMTDALRGLLSKLKGERQPALTEPISLIQDAKKCLRTACRRLSYPAFSHHDFRHFFATTCIESAVDIPTVSKWLGHRDGGALAMRVYGHLRQEHSYSMIKRVAF